MRADNENPDILHTFPDGLQLTVHEIAHGRFGWWIDAPGSEAKLLTSGRPTSRSRRPYPYGLLQGVEASFQAAVEAGKREWNVKFGQGAA